MKISNSYMELILSFIRRILFDGCFWYTFLNYEFLINLWKGSSYCKETRIVS